MDSQVQQSAGGSKEPQPPNEMPPVTKINPRLAQLDLSLFTSVAVEQEGKVLTREKEGVTLPPPAPPALLQPAPPVRSRGRLPPPPPPPPEYIDVDEDVLIDLTRPTPDIEDDSNQESESGTRASSSIGEFPEEPNEELGIARWVSIPTSPVDDDDEDDMMDGSQANDSEDFKMDEGLENQTMVKRDVLQAPAAVERPAPAASNNNEQPPPVVQGDLGDIRVEQSLKRQQSKGKGKEIDHPITKKKNIFKYDPFNPNVRILTLFPNNTTHNVFQHNDRLSMGNPALYHIAAARASTANDLKRNSQLIDDLLGVKDLLKDASDGLEKILQIVEESQNKGS